MRFLLLTVGVLLAFFSQPLKPLIAEPFAFKSGKLLFATNGHAGDGNPSLLSRGRLAIASPDGTILYRQLPGLGQDSSYLLSPDGQYILFYFSGKTGDGNYVTPIDLSFARRIPGTTWLDWKGGTQLN